MNCITIIGPTASGKTDVALALAKIIGGEIINADSRQVYKDVSIGTATPVIEHHDDTSCIVDGIRHYGIHCIPLNESFSAGAFRRMFDTAVDAITSQGKTPILVGGTGLYIHAALDGIADIPAIPTSVSEHVRTLIANGTKHAYQILTQVDPATSAVIDRHNPRRISRALEVFFATNTPLSVWQQHTNTTQPIASRMFGLAWDKTTLHHRIDTRIDHMIEHGLFDEVRALIAQGYARDVIEKAGIGYAHIATFLDGKISRDEAIMHMKQETRQYAKRQMTWFKKDTRIAWIEMQKPLIPSEIAQLIVGRIEVSPKSDNY